MMENQERKAYPVQEAMKLAQTAAGKQLIQLLQSTGGDDLRKAMELAAAGDYSKAQKTISNLMQNPEAKKLFDQMGGKK